jgi:glycosyltransferase involved in cell wall biosynthesis
MPKVTVLIPVYNEEATVLAILERVNAQRIDGVTFEVLVVDDGSSDATPAKLKDNPQLYTRLIALPKNGGKGAAVKAGLREATGDFVLFQDADLEYNPEDYAKLLRPIVRFDADLVMGSRMVGSEYTRVFYFWNKVGNRFITLLFNVLNNTTFTDIYSCYLLYRRSLVDVESLVTEGWQQHAEILSRAMGRARTMYEVPITYHGRTYAEGKKIRAHHIIAVIWTIVLRRFIR